ncbi:MAG: hypothetical protein JST89_13430 [Cyanobacteria bacterium SZAS-4]|nr:hypothetical protein [Cyanobacteria bacterium SZAS-4]
MPSDPVEVVRNHFKKLCENDLDAAYADLSPRWQSKQDLSSFRKANLNAWQNLSEDQTFAAVLVASELTSLTAK